MKLAVINAGSSSLKFSLFNNKDLTVKCIVERIGLNGSFFKSENITLKKNIETHNVA